MIDYAILGYSAIAGIAFFIIVYFISLAIKNAGIVDVGWGSSFIVSTFVAFFLNLGLNNSYSWHQIIVTVLVFIWGTRLSLHIGLRNIGKPEDFRYKKYRDEWGKAFPIKSFFMIFMPQAIWMLIINSPALFINSVDSNPSMGTLDIILVSLGSLVWLSGFLFEAIADYQLKQFKKNPENKGKLMTSGLWRYSRHPNYFGEALLWWGPFIIAIPLMIKEPGGWLGWFTVLGPILITYMIRFFTGVPRLEEKYADREDFQEYAKKTSIFIPWFPKKDEED